ncbi:NUDIX domain-containing protein [Georgenia thermotolerans]|uniref:NUDIX domain-containing protein n=1 Tax=Georgenia thermotolerans TaxID=527326 RepID=A0A7J5UMH0_9MICO|nr:NUDIX hydrolase [Georgenia thermotolerans]KAE8763471.1 NUDIX domain-containing protein [Georgenia thermotolerans]
MSPARELADAKDTGREVVAHRTIHAGRVFDLVGDEVRLQPDDEKAVVREYLDHPGAVAVVALREGEAGEEVLLIRQYRHPVRAQLWEVPAGLLDVEGEDYRAAAERELYEEADLRAARWDVLVDYFTSPGGSDESLRVYLARDVTEVDGDERHEREDEERDMATVWVPLDEAVAAVHAGRIHNPSAVVGVLAAASARAQGWAPLRPADAEWMR